MSRILVSDAELGSAAGRLSAIPAQLAGHREGLGVHAGAAAGTPAEGAVSALAAHFGTMLPL